MSRATRIEVVDTINGALVTKRKCIKCEEFKSLENFRNIKTHETSVCIECYNLKARTWYRTNNTKASALTKQRVELKRHLINEWGSRDDINLIKDFEYRCALTHKTSLDNDVGVDHFIAIATGHGGTYKGNLVPLERRVNISKHANNPFEWIKDRGEIEAVNFNSVVKYLADENGLSESNFKAYVYWCYAHPRTVEQIKADYEKYGRKRNSIEIWIEEKE